MTIDERLDRLTERHEAMAQSLELFIIADRERGARIDAQIQALNVQIQALNVQIDALITNVDSLIRASTSLLEVARSHETRIERLEDKAQ